MNYKMIVVVVVVIAIASCVFLAVYSKPTEELGLAGLPLYPGASSSEAGSGEVPIFPSTYATTTYLTNASIDEVWDWYKPEMSQRGWILSLEIKSSPFPFQIANLPLAEGISGFTGPGELNFLAYTKESKVATIKLENRDGHTQIELGYGEKAVVEDTLSNLENAYSYPNFFIGVGVKENEVKIWHGGGDTIVGAFKDNTWENLEVWINGSIANVSGALLNGASLNDSDFVPNDMLKITFPASENHEVSVGVIYKPTNKILLSMSQSF